MTLDIYNYHTKPETISGYVNKHLLPDAAFDQLMDQDFSKATEEQLKQAIIKYPYFALLYAYNVTKHRWPEAEPIILKNASIAALYAQKVIHGRWLEAEDIIKDDEDARQMYEHAFNIKL